VSNRSLSRPSLRSARSTITFTVGGEKQRAQPQTRTIAVVQRVRRTAGQFPYRYLSTHASPGTPACPTLFRASSPSGWELRPSAASADVNRIRRLAVFRTANQETAPKARSSKPNNTSCLGRSCPASTYQDREYSACCYIVEPQSRSEVGRSRPRARVGEQGRVCFAGRSALRFGIRSGFRLQCPCLPCALLPLSIGLPWVYP